MLKSMRGTNSVAYPRGPLADALQQIARVINAYASKNKAA